MSEPIDIDLCRLVFCERCQHVVPAGPEFAVPGDHPCDYLRAYHLRQRVEAIRDRLVTARKAMEGQGHSNRARGLAQVGSAVFALGRLAAMLSETQRDEREKAAEQLKGCYHSADDGVDCDAGPGDPGHDTNPNETEAP